MDFHVYVHLEHPAVQATLDRVLSEIAQIKHLIHLTGEQIMSAISDLQAAVAAEDTVIESAVTLLQGLKAALDAAIAAGDPAALTALSADIGTRTRALSDAIVANTPAAAA